MPPSCHVFETRRLLPGEWRAAAGDGPVRAFNPGLLRDGAGWLLAYRVVAPDGRRRIALCRLDRSFEVIEGSAVPLTDQVRFRPGADYPELATQWFADPRLYRFGNRLFVYWNSGWHEPHNCQFLQELDPASLQPRGAPRELQLEGRRKLEKNWTFFAPSSGEFRAVYSVTPHRILGAALSGDGDLAFAEVAQTEWSIADYPACHGGLRGGTPPVLVDGRFWSFCHTVHDGPDGYCYRPAAYTFGAQPPFAPLERPIRPLELGNPFGGRRTFERLNPAVGEVIYPCGAAWDDARWIISHGINDEYCALSLISPDAVRSTLEPV
ncbi:MAG: hypothetical protein JNL92_17165 [Opitutaceae bacterium]|nr:hypothetical protein [Opitutaceae bacterium]